VERLPGLHKMLAKVLDRDQPLSQHGAGVFFRK